MEGLDLALAAEANLCPHCGDDEATETCEWCKEKECKECFQEHMVECNHCDGEGEVPRSWVSDSGDRWNPPTLDVTRYEDCEYCNEGKVCVDEDVPEFSWDAESFSADITIKICDACEEQTDWTIIECKECGAENCVQCLDDSQVGWIDECCRIHWRAGNYDAEEHRYMRDCEDCGGDRIWCGGCGNCMGCGECYCAYAAERNEIDICDICDNAEVLSEDDGYLCGKCGALSCHACGSGDPDEHPYCMPCIYQREKDAGEWPDDSWYDAETNGDTQLEESKKRTQMSMIRTTLSVLTFGIVILSTFTGWNVWMNKEQEKDITAILAEL